MSHKRGPVDTEDLHDLSGVYIEYPVFVALREADDVAVVGDAQGKLLPLFTDHDNAERFIEDKPLAGHRPFALPTREHL